MEDDKGRKHPRINASTEIYLQNLYRPMIEQLYEMTGISLDLSQ